ncbi:MAG: hypothetical protein ACPG1A_11985 [Halioglobus sp.]
MIFRRRKPPLTLHIGLGKTGTTVLQEFFWANRDQLAKHGVDYPDYGVVAGAHHLLSPHAPADLKRSWNFIPVEKWAPRLAKRKSASILLSSELIAAAELEVVNDFAATLSQHFLPRIVAYVRRQDDLIMASYNQNVKTGKQRRKLVDVYPNMLHRFDYPKLLAPWAQTIGQENIVVRPYERSQFHAGDLRYDFLYHLFGVDDYEHFTQSNEDPNPRLSPRAVEYKRLLNNVVEDPGKLRRFQALLTQYSIDHAQSSGVAREQFSPEQRVEILASYEEGNREIARTYLNRPDGRLFVDELPAPDAPWDEKPLVTAQAREITAYLREQDPKLIGWLESALPDFVEDEKYGPRSSARFLTATL